MFNLLFKSIQLIRNASYASKQNKPPRASKRISKLAPKENILNVCYFLVFH